MSKRAISSSIWPAALVPVEREVAVEFLEAAGAVLDRRRRSPARAAASLLDRGLRRSTRADDGLPCVRRRDKSGEHDDDKTDDETGSGHGVTPSKQEGFYVRSVFSGSTPAARRAGNVQRGPNHGQKQRGDGHERHRIRGVDAEQKRSQHPGQAERGQCPRGDAGRAQAEPPRDVRPPDASRRGTEREPQPDLAAPLRDVEREHPRDPHQPERDRRRREDDRQIEGQPRAGG